MAVNCLAVLLAVSFCCSGSVRASSPPELPSTKAVRMPEALVHDFAGQRYSHALRMLKRNPQFIYARDSESQQTPLHLAGSSTVTKLLLRNGANPYLHDVWGNIPLQKAAEMSQKEVVRGILSRGIPLDLRSALYTQEREIAKRIIAKYPDSVKPYPQNADLWGNTTPLGIAAKQGDREMVMLLLQHGDPVNGVTSIPNFGDATPLCNAVWSGHEEIVKILCEAGADTNVAGRESLLDYARRRSSKRIVEILLQYGARPSESSR